MEVLRPAIAGIETAPAMPEDPELTNLRAHVARLEAEREALQWAAGHDELTGLPNRRLFKTLATRVIDTAPESAAVMVLDLDGFKPINDRFGHAAGDQVLRIIAFRLASWAGDNLVARLGGDEFAVLLTNAGPAMRSHSWRTAVLTLAALIAQPIQLARHAVAVTASIGIAPCWDSPCVVELLHHADVAMYRAKHHTKATGISGTACVYSPALERERKAISSQPVILDLTIVKVKRDAPNPPPCDPDKRDPEGIAPPCSYRVGDRVWVHRHGAWRPGVIEATSPRAILARYRPGDGPGTGVDTVAAEHVAVR